MKKWTFSGILALILLLGSLVLLGCFFAAELFPSFAGGTEPMQTISTPTKDTTIEDSSTQTTEDTTTENTATEDTATENTTTEDTTTEDTATEDTSSGSETTVYTVAATHAFVYEPASGTLLYSKGDMDQRIAPASVTKLLTAYVGLQHLSCDTVLTVDANTLALLSPYSSVAGLLDGYQLTTEMCVQTMMMPSGNDAAHVLAVAAGRAIGGADLSPQAALDTFMNEVNQVAASIGMTNTHFVTPDGMDSSNHYTSLKDLVTLAQLVLQNDTLMKYARMYHQNLTLTSGQSLSVKNTNLLLDPTSKYYTSGACGLKTGTTSKAGACLLSAFQKDGKYVIVGVFGCPTDSTRYEDTLHLYKTYG